MKIPRILYPYQVRYLYDLILVFTAYLIQQFCTVFSIHGNHDDPTRESGRFDDSLATLDLLSASNLLNYFGKSSHIDEIEITPLLIRKGDVHVALYGLGAVRDERLNRLWNQKNVKFNRPSTEQGKDSYFNIFVIHQNRDSGRGTKNCVHESMIPEWMDLVIWETSTNVCQKPSSL